MKKSTMVKNALMFPKMGDSALTSHNDIVCALTKPSPVDIRLDFQTFIDLMRIRMCIVFRISL